ncbi:hypothetical protein B0A54_09211 [Friedmanniomyces endolithicus]|uniref:CID domain-containing protein n=1 Tax=Friedmanniomyces endolithicus TaxID=329885 RepID=A0A4U0UQM8_9PEZI|nr:hypothetical protein B0A54_09211 [Friedmanniomyces endolithicus]
MMAQELQDAYADFVALDSDPSVDGKVKEPPQPHFKRLHVLYIVSDVLITLQRQHRSAQNPVEASGVETLKRHLPALAALATFKGREEYARTLPAVMSLLNIWSIEGLISEADLVNVYAAAISADEDRSSWEDFLAHLEAKPTIPGVSAREASIANLALPKRHGVPNDPTAPWHELPATNGLYMKQTRGYPLKASVMPMGGYDLDPADEQSDAALRLDVQWLHKEILHAFDKFTDPEDVKDIDALGNVIFKDPARPTRNYWGWSLDGVSKMKDVSKYHQENASGYADVGNGRLSDPMDQVNAAVDRARSLAAERAGSMRGRGVRHRFTIFEVIDGAAAVPEHRLYPSAEGEINCRQQIPTPVLVSSASNNILHTMSPGSSDASGTLSTLGHPGSRQSKPSTTLACESKNLPQTACGLNIISTSPSTTPRPPSPSAPSTSDTEFSPLDKGSKDAPTDPLLDAPEPDESDHTDFRCRLYAGSWWSLPRERCVLFQISSAERRAVQARRRIKRRRMEQRQAKAKMAKGSWTERPMRFAFERSR